MARQLIEVDPHRLRAANKLFRKLPGQIRNDLRKYQRAAVTPIWKEEVQSRYQAQYLSKKVFKTGNTVKAGAVIILKASGSNRKLRGGGVVSDLLKQAEFGSLKQNKYETYARVSPKGKRHVVRRRTSKQIPMRRRGGYVLYPSAGAATKRMVSLSVQTITRKIYEAAEGLN